MDLSDGLHIELIFTGVEALSIDLSALIACAVFCFFEGVYASYVESLSRNHGHVCRAQHTIFSMQVPFLTRVISGLSTVRLELALSLTLVLVRCLTKILELILSFLSFFSFVLLHGLFKELCVVFLEFLPVVFTLILKSPHCKIVLIRINARV